MEKDREETEEEEIICPKCAFGDMQMVGDPEYNDEWHCENCGHYGGSSYGIPKGLNKYPTL